VTQGPKFPERSLSKAKTRTIVDYIYLYNEKILIIGKMVIDEVEDHGCRSEGTKTSIRVSPPSKERNQKI